MLGFVLSLTHIHCNIFSNIHTSGIDNTPITTTINPKIKDPDPVFLINSWSPNNNPHGD